MKHRQIRIIALLLFCIYLLSNPLPAQNFKHIGELCEYDYGYKKKELTLFDDFFEYKKYLISFLDIKNGENIAEVGSADGYNLGVLSLLYDSIHFYAEDIGEKYISQKKLNKVVKHYNKLRKTPQTNTFQYVIGDFTHTNLPAKYFDKIIMIASFHEFSNLSEMIQDMASKLKPNGKLIIMEAFSIGKKIIYCEDHHRGLRIDTINEVMNKEGFYLTRMRSPESNINNYINCLAYEKNKTKSDEFFALQKKIDPIIQLLFKLNELVIAKDTIEVKAISDSIYKYKNELYAVYPGLECWIKDLAFKWIGVWDSKSTLREYEAGLNILTLTNRINPNSFQNEYWLGVMNEEKGNLEVANVFYKKSLVLNKNNKAALNKLKQHDRTFTLSLLSY